MTRAEILAIVTVQEGYSTPPDGIISYALRMYSKKFPLMVEEIYEDVLGETDIVLDEPVYSTNIKCTVSIDDYEYELSNFEFIASLNKIKFYTPITYNDLNLYYYTVHKFSTTECTIPDIHGEAFAYLLCHFISLRALSLYYSADTIQSVDNGIMKVTYDTSKSSKQGYKTYYERYLEALAAVSPHIGYIRDDVPSFKNTSDIINYPFTTEW